MPSVVWTPDELSQRLWGKKTCHSGSMGRMPNSADSTPQGTPNTQALAPKPARSNSSIWTLLTGK